MAPSRGAPKSLTENRILKWTFGREEETLKKNSLKTEDLEGLPKTRGLSNSLKMHGAEHLNGVQDLGRNRRVPKRTRGTFGLQRQLGRQKTPKRTLQESTLGAEHFMVNTSARNSEGLWEKQRGSTEETKTEEPKNEDLKTSLREEWELVLEKEDSKTVQKSLV